MPLFGPSRLGSCSAPPQKASEASGSTRNDATVATTAPAARPHAGRHRRAHTKYRRNVPGVSLTAVTRPISTPRVHRGRTAARSTRQTSTMKALTWPNRIPSDSGCSQTISDREQRRRHRPQGAGPAQQRTAGDPHGHRRRGHLRAGPQPGQQPERHQRDRRGQQRRERRVGERQQLRRLGELLVDRPAEQDRAPGLAVDLQVDLPLVLRPGDQVVPGDRPDPGHDDEHGEQPDRTAPGERAAAAELRRAVHACILPDFGGNLASADRERPTRNLSRCPCHRRGSGASLW